MCIRLSSGGLKNDILHCLSNNSRVQYVSISLCSRFLHLVNAFGLEMTMRTITQAMYDNSVIMDLLQHNKQAKPIGRVDAGSECMWVSTDTREKVVRIGLVIKDRIKETI
jgi:hypothetical protein